MKVRTRIAPSPTGDDLHIGNAYTALINYVYAKKHHGQFIVRIEDTDRTRLVKGSEQRILASLAWLGIPSDEGPDKENKTYGPYRQSERLELYRKYGDVLIKKGHAYYCFCTPERLAEMRKNQDAKKMPPMYDGRCRELKINDSQLRIKNGEKCVIRLKVPREGTTSFKDLIRGDISFENNLIDDTVILKSDGFPTYHLGVVVDDHLMEISHILRGEEWISSTPKHVLLYRFLAWDSPVFAHMPLLRNPDKSKLSKRKNPVWVSWYREQGFLPEAILNYLGTMAWAFPDGRDIFSIREMMEVFELEKVRTTAPVFDVEKLRWINGEYIRKAQSSKLKVQIEEFYGKRYPVSMIEKVLPLVRERIKTLAEFEALAGFFFSRPKDFERPLKVRPLKVAREALTACEWKHDGMEQALRAEADKAGMSAKDVFMELRVAVTGKTVGPPILESLEILGQDEVLARIKR
jgi:glutamyl-tRNA synthetase